MHRPVCGRADRIQKLSAVCSAGQGTVDPMGRQRPRRLRMMRHSLGLSIGG